MNWTSQDKAAAALESWELVETIDRDSLQLRVYGLNGMGNASAMRHVWNCARGGSAFHRRALQIVTASLKPIKRGKK